MNAAPVIPPAPLGATCPLWMLVEWAEVFRNGLKSRSRLLLEVKAADGPFAAGERWLTLVTWSLHGALLPRVLPKALRQQCITPADVANHHRTVGKIFRQMKTSRAPVWFLPLTRWGGSAVFVRAALDDPSVAALSTFNRGGRRPTKWILPRPREYSTELRQAYVKTWSLNQAKPRAGG